MLTFSKKSIFKKVLPVVLLSVLLVATATFAILKHIQDQANAITDDNDNVYVYYTASDIIDYGIPYEGYDGHAYKFNMYVDGQLVGYGQCINPSKDRPYGGPFTAEQIEATDLKTKKLKLLVYLSTVHNSVSDSFVSQMFAITNMPNPTADQQYAYLHATMGWINEGEDGARHLDADWKVYVQRFDTEFITPAINNNAAVWTLAQGYQLYKTSTGTGYQDIMWIENREATGSITVTKAASDVAGCVSSFNTDVKFSLINKTGLTVNYNGTDYANNATIISNASISNCSVTWSGLPYGNYEVLETSTSTDYTVDVDNPKTVNLVSSSVSVTFTNQAVPRSSITVQKRNYDTNQCMEDFVSNAKFTLKNSSGTTLYSNSSLDSNCNLTWGDLPYDTYTITESYAGTVYTVDTASQTVTTSNTQLNVTVNFTNTPKKGAITVYKKDSDTNSCNSTGDLSLIGTTFEIYNQTGVPIKYGSSTIANGHIVDTKSITSVSSGSCSVTFENLPYGNYLIKESQATTGYTAATDQTVNLSGATASATFVDTSVKGKITVTKKDSKTNSCTTQGNTTFNGTTFTITNNSTNPVYVGSTPILPGAVIATKTLTGGACSIAFDNLPYGRYKITETAAGSGYNVASAQDFTIPSTSGATELTATFTDETITGKITVNKTDSETGVCTPQGNATFNNTQFRLVNISTNAVYYDNGLVAPNGEIDTKTLTNNACSVTFENLPYGKYTLEEVAVGNGYNRNVTVATVEIPTSGSVNISTTYANKPIVGKVTVEKIDKDTGTCTTTGDLSFNGASFSITNNSTNPVYYQGTNYANGQIIDTKFLGDGECSVTFEGLPYGEYIVKEASTSEGYVLNTTPHTVTIPDDSGTVIDVSTTFENQVIRGDLKFVKMDGTNNKVMRDVLFSISSVDENNNIKETHIVVSNKDGVVDTSSSFIPHSTNTNGYDALYDEVDPISFSGFGTWFGLDKNGNNIPVHDDVGALPYGTYIIQELRCGSNLFCTGILNQKVTVTINSANQVINLGDWDNACTNFSLGTTATDAADDDHFIEVGQEVKLKDTIDFCVKPNTNFTIKGILMDKETEEPLLINGATVESSVDIRSEEECGQTEMIFTFDASELGGKTLVVFETLYYKDDIITKHDDIDDVEQTVDIISLRTYATNKDTGDKILPLGQDVEIKDEVYYCLRPGVEYTVKGVLMNKATGNGLLVNSQPVEAEVTFTPEEACGEIDMFYKLNTTGLGGVDLVIFESLYYEGELIVDHRDINNASETVSVEAETPAPAPNTGSSTALSSDGKAIFGFGFIIVISLATVGGYGIKRYIGRRKIFSHK